jgi:hypothetical protein
MNEPLSENHQACENTDREIWRKVPGDYYADSIHVTKEGAIGINCGGFVRVMPVEAWFEAAGGKFPAAPEPKEPLSSNPKRYVNWCQATHGHEMLEVGKGPWVLYEDYERLRAALDKLPAQLNNVAAWLNNGCEVKHAVTELGLIASKLRPADETTGCDLPGCMRSEPHDHGPITAEETKACAFCGSDLADCPRASGECLAENGSA